MVISGGVVGFLRRRLRLIAATFTTAIVLTGLMIVVIPQSYIASTLILFDEGPASHTVPQQATRTIGPVRIDSEVEMLRSDGVLIEVIATLGLAEVPEFSARRRLLGERPSPPLQETLARLRSATTIERRGQTQLLVVSARAHDPGRAALIANTIAETHIRMQLDAKVETLLASGKALAAQAERIRMATMETGALFEATPEDRGAPPGVALLPAGWTGDAQAWPHPAPHARAPHDDLVARSLSLFEEAALRQPDSRIVSRATTTAASAFPDPLLMLALGGLLGLGAGIGGGLVREGLTCGFVSDSQLATITRKPSLGEVPLQPLAAGDISVAALMVEAPLSPFAESVRRIRTGIDQRLEDRTCGPGTGARVIMVSSSVTHEGKTALALSLARAYAASGTRTLVLDCDLRQPSLHLHLEVRPDIGLFDYLSGTGQGRSFAPMIVMDAETGVSALVGVRGSEIPTDQMFSGRPFRRLLAAAIANFDVVILDTPPLLPVVDGLHLARHADAIVFVVKWSSTPQTMVRSAIARLETVQKTPPPIFTVLNQQADGFVFTERRRDAYTRA